MPQRRPSYSDEGPWGVSFFRTRIDGSIALSNLTLPRSLFGRSEINGASFENTDLSESSLCWNDFVDVNFSQAKLARADLRASDFEHCDFRTSDLREADLRRSLFRRCAFDGAEMAGAVLTHKQGQALLLSDLQRAQISWADTDGPEPSGG
ncbi:pentapeptide repeat-containing protein [Variovorax sp. OK202]|uniref:pentapeptide repeat-containing protein n=1 Tax=unclassified Variovorax TaxID=663243 RepID=UPI003527C5F3